MTVAVAVVLGLAVLGGGVWLLSTARRTEGERFRRVVADHDEVAVLMHPAPDPDALASALAVARLAEAQGTSATIQHPGQIRHQENRAFVTVLDLEIERLGSARELAADAVVLVDHNRPRGFEGAEGVEPTAVVDHHPGDGRGRTFTDVRTDYGACASILAEYYRALGAARPSDEDADEPGPDALALTPELATGLLYGILSDTKNLTRGTDAADFRAVEYLNAAVDRDLLDRIANPEVDEEVLEVQSRAIAEREERTPYAISDVGHVENLDAIPQAADELLHLEGTTAVVVIGEKDGRLHFSARSRDDRVHVGRALEAAVEDIPMSGAGGHARMGGGQVSIDHMEGLGPSSGISRAEFRERLFEALAGEL